MLSRDTQLTSELHLPASSFLLGRGNLMGRIASFQSPVGVGGGGWGAVSGRMPEPLKATALHRINDFFPLLAPNFRMLLAADLRVTLGHNATF